MAKKLVVPSVFAPHFCPACEIASDPKDVQSEPYVVDFKKLDHHQFNEMMEQVVAMHYFPEGVL